MLINNLINKYRFSLRKSKKIFQSTKDLLIKQRNRISNEVYQHIKSQLLELEQSILNKDAQKAFQLAKNISATSRAKLKKNTFDYFNEWVLGIGFTLLTVTLINQLWFQHYQIPSGSMRPTLLEKDRVIATKTCFGINFPFKQSHLYFDSNNLKRGNIAIFTVDNLPPEENRARYLFIFNTKKQMVKRLIGKPGDTLYFYGGKIYGIDKDQKPITEFQNSEIFKSLEHIPVSNFEGKVVSGNEPHPTAQHLTPSVYLYQMGQAVAKLYVNSHGSLHGKLSNGHQWIEESPKLEYKDLWGIKNFAMTRMLTRQQAIELDYDLKNSEAAFFLELHHSPHTNYPKPHLGIDLQGRLRPMITPEKSLLPLNAEHIEKIKKAMTTARFVIKDGIAGNYSLGKSFNPHSYSPKFNQIPDGTYEFLSGIAYQVSASGVQKTLPQSHPLNQLDEITIQRFFNLGMEMITLYEPDRTNIDFIPHRFAYFKEGELYLMNHAIYSKDDPTLLSFVTQEKNKAHGFFDHGPPTVNGEIDYELIKNYGLHIPNGYYLFLGDNHAGSRDCRDFGFIPEKNIQGSPAFIIWPSSSRFGPLHQSSLRWFNLPNLVVCSCALLVISITTIYSNKRRKKEF